MTTERDINPCDQELSLMGHTLVNYLTGAQKELKVIQ